MQFYTKLVDYYQKMYRLFVATSNSYARDFEAYIERKRPTSHADLEHWQRQFDNSMRNRGLL